MRQFNAVILGAGGVGKSALTCRYFRNEFVENYDPTIEEYYSKVVEIDGILSQLEVLDTAGVEQFRTMSEWYIKSGMGFILAFSLTSANTLQEIDGLRQQIYQIKGGSSTQIPIVVVATKSDLTAEREVQRGTLQKLATTWNLPFYETSSKMNWHVNDVFEELVRQMRDRYPPEVRRRQRKGCIVQ